MSASKIFAAIAFLHASVFCFCQSIPGSVPDKINTEKFSLAVSKRAGKLEGRIVTKSEKTLDHLRKQEEKLWRHMLGTKDSVQAKAALAGINNQYKNLRDKLRNSVATGAARQYIPKLDTLTTALKFLSQQGIAQDARDALTKTLSLQDKFQHGEEIKKFIQQRRQLLKQQLENLGLVKQLKQYNKEAYYYSQQINEYKELLKDSKKAERKALELLGKTKLFNDFMRKNSMLASLFRLPSDPNDPLAQANLAGLQTRASLS